jgi:Leucine-rich repeat (LRR) protein
MTEFKSKMTEFELKMTECKSNNVINGELLYKLNPNKSNYNKFEELRVPNLPSEAIISSNLNYVKVKLPVMSQKKMDSGKEKALIDFNNMVNSVIINNTKILRVSDHVDYRFLHKIPPSIGKMTSLKHLSLERMNFITLENEGKLSSDIGKLTNLLSLNCDTCGINQIPDEIGNLTKLLQLNANNNSLTSLPKTLIKCKSLKEIELWMNYFVTIPRILETYNKDGTRTMENMFGIVGKEETNPFFKNLVNVGLFVQHKNLGAFPPYEGALPFEDIVENMMHIMDTYR